MTDRLRDDVRDALLGVRALSGGCEARFRFAAELPLFRGHFPGDPVLPGVHQIEMVRAALSSFRGLQHRVRQVRSAKFKKRILPGDEAVVRLTCAQANGNFATKAVIAVGEQEAALVSLVTFEERPD